MKKSLIALAVLAAAGTASAQSSVTLFGIVDVTVQRLFNKGGGASVTRVTDSGYYGSRLGFRGTEDLGGGMSASFWLEAGTNPDNGTGDGTSFNNQAGGGSAGNGLTFNRRSTVSLAGGWGEVRVGRDHTPQFWNLNVFDPFGTNGVGSAQTLNSIVTGTTSVRASNSIGYFLPGKLGGFYGQVQHYRGENLSTAVNEDAGNGLGLRVGYANGPFNVALAISRTENEPARDIKQNNIGGQWDFGMAAAMFQITRDEGVVGAVNADGKAWLLGALVPVGAGEIRAAFSQYTTDLGAGVEPRSRKLAIGYVHNLSKRTALYTTYARVKNSRGANSPVAGGAGNPGINANSSGFDFGLRHSF
jgi:predicted porin